MTKLPKFRRTRTLNDDPNVIPRYRKGYEFWGSVHEDGTVVEEHGMHQHSIYDVERIDSL